MRFHVQDLCPARRFLPASPTLHGSVCLLVLLVGIGSIRQGVIFYGGGKMTTTTDSMLSLLFTALFTLLGAFLATVWYGTAHMSTWFVFAVNFGLLGLVIDVLYWRIKRQSRQCAQKRYETGLGYLRKYANVTRPIHRETDMMEVLADPNLQPHQRDIVRHIYAFHLCHHLNTLAEDDASATVSAP